jgi:hypothetical protein
MITHWAGKLSEPGRPPGTAQGLLYNRSSQTLIADMLSDESPVHRLYYRKLPGTAYLSIAVQDEGDSQSDAQSCESSPYIIFNVMRYTRLPQPPPPAPWTIKEKEPSDPGWGGNWIGIHRFNLVTGEDARVFDELRLRLPQPFTSGWISGILSASNDGSGAVVVMGLSTGIMRYFVYELSFIDGLGRQIAELPYTFL